MNFILLPPVELFLWVKFASRSIRQENKIYLLWNLKIVILEHMYLIFWYIWLQSKNYSIFLIAFTLTQKKSYKNIASYILTDLESIILIFFEVITSESNKFSQIKFKSFINSFHSFDFSMEKILIKLINKPLQYQK